MSKGWLEKLNQSKDGINHVLSAMLARILPQMVFKQVLAFGEILDWLLNSHEISLGTSMTRCSRLIAQMFKESQIS